MSYKPLFPACPPCTERVPEDFCGIHRRPPVIALLLLVLMRLLNRRFISCRFYFVEHGRLLDSGIPKDSVASEARAVEVLASDL